MAERPDDSVLQTVADSITDGRPVDWPDATSHTREAVVLEELRLIDGIARFHEEQVAVPRSAAPVAAAGAAGQPRRAEPLGTWSGFELRASLGHGSFGDVYRAFDPKLQQECAVKLLPGGGDEAVARSRILAEARMLARVKHANVVAIRGVDDAANPPGLWMELVEGRTLDELVRSHGPFSAREAATIGLDVCQALSAVHNAGLLHGDVKAHNIMREAGGRIVLMDFGAGRDATAAPTAATTGTPLYLAPEVFAGQPRTRAADVYSLGVLLYFLVTGAYPIEADSRTGVVRAHETPQPIRLRDRRADLPDAFVACVERALSLVPANRFQTIGEFAADLAQAAGLGTAPITTAPNTAALPSRWPMIMLLVVVGIAVLVAGAGVVWRVHQETVIATKAADARKAAGVPGSAPAPGSYQIEAALFRRRAGGASERLAPDATVGPGDRLFLEVRTSVPTHVYVINEDDHGESYVLFPLPGQSLANPLSAGTVQRLPGRVGAEDTDWQVTSAGGREHFLIFASPERLGALETMLAALPRPEAGRPVGAAPVAPATAQLLRGIGGLAAAPQESAAPQASRLSAQFATPLSAFAETVSGVWVRQLTVQNPR